jgi:hypothetical protein
MNGIPGASEVAQEDGGPPTDPPVNIEIEVISLKRYQKLLQYQIS